MSQSHLRSGGFSALRTIEYHPDDEVAGEVLEAMKLPGWNEQKRTSLNRLVTLSIEKQTLPTSHEIHLVSRMGLLRIVANRRVEFYCKRAMRKNWHRQIPSRRWALGQCLSQTDMDDSCGWLHTPAPDERCSAPYPISSAPVLSPNASTGVPILSSIDT